MMDLNQAIKETAMVLQQSVQGCDEFDAGAQVLAAARTHADWLESFPSDEDVSVFADAFWEYRRNNDVTDTPDHMELFRAALQAVADTRRTEEEGT